MMPIYDNVASGVSIDPAEKFAERRQAKTKLHHWLQESFYVIPEIDVTVANYKRPWLLSHQEEIDYW